MEINNNKYDVEYNGRYPTLCFGSWTIKVNDKTFSPEDSSDFNTFGTYCSWLFVDWSEEWEYHEDGLELEEWIPYIKEEDTMGLWSWLVNEFGEDAECHLRNLFPMIQADDFRSISCGGCI